MTFRQYLRWDGGVTIVVGVALLTLGIVDGHEHPLEAAMSATIMLTGTGVFMRWRHRAAFLRPADWFTSAPLRAACTDDAVCPRRRLVLLLILQAAAVGLFTVAASVATGFWLTYMDFAIWAVAVGVIKAGPATVVIARREADAEVTYRVARRGPRGPIELTATYGSTRPRRIA